MVTEKTIDLSSQKARESGRFARDIIWVALAQLFNSIILGIVTMPVLTKVYSPEIFGIWIQINVTLTLLGPCLTLQLGQAVVRFLSHEEDKTRRRQALGSMLTITVLISALVLTVTNLAAPQFSQIFFASPDYTLFIRLTFIWLFVNVLFNFFIAYFRARNKMRLLSVRQVAVSVITMAAVIGL
jgi:O-antigen/teichoic acid export membrane protein